MQMFSSWLNMVGGGGISHLEGKPEEVFQNEILNNMGMEHMKSELRDLEDGIRRLSMWLPESLTERMSERQYLKRYWLYDFQN